MRGMRIVQISDLHFTHFCLNPSLFRLKRWVGMLNWFLFRRNDFFHHPLQQLPDLWRDLQADLVLVGGDLTTTALPGEFQEAKEFFQQCAIPQIFIPGNHDHYTKDAVQKQLFYRNFPNPKALGTYTLAEHGVEAHQIAPSWWCVALDTAPATSLLSSRGEFSPEVEKNLEALLRLIPKSDRIVMLNHFPFFQNDFPQHRLYRGDRLRNILECNSNIVLYLHGHTHRHTIADLQVNSLPIVVDSGCSVQRNRSTWNLLDLSEEKCTIQVYSWQQDSWKCDKERAILWERK